MKMTTTEIAFLSILSDGMRHPREEFRLAINNNQATFDNVVEHMYRIRKKLETQGETVICELYQRTLHYRHVRLLHNPYKD